jgi:hypothetical protein
MNFLVKKYSPPSQPWICWQVVLQRMPEIVRLLLM